MTGVQTCALPIYSLNEAVFIIETGTRIILNVNRAAERMFGYSREELVGATTVCLHVNEGMYHRFAAEIIVACAAGDVYETVFQMRRRDGSVFDTEHCVTPIRDEAGCIVSRVCVVRDITQRARVEKALRNAALEQAAILDNTCVGIALIRDRTFVWANNRFKEMLGYRQGELSGRPVRIIYPVDETYAEIGKVGYTTVAQGAVYETEMELVRKDGSIFWAKCYGRAMDPDNLSAGTIWVVEDISTRKQAESELVKKSRDLEDLNRNLEERVRQAVDELARALAAARNLNEEQSQFIGLISHELRTPLSIIDGAAQLLLLSACPDSECLKLAGHIRSASTRLTSLVDTCLAQERISSAGWVPEIHKEPLPELIEDAVAMCRKLTDKHDILADMRLLPESYPCDAALMRVMLNNLLENAIKYSPAGGPISMKGFAGEAGSVILQVSDKGIGIAPDHAEKIFDRFYRTWQIADVPGAGLGLHLVRKIAQLHGGDVSCQSRLGAGSTFTVTLRSDSGPV